MNLQQLLDEREIVRGLSLFARIADSKAWDRLAEVFATDLTFDYGAAGLEEGIDALRANMRRYLDRCGGSQHLIGSILVDFNGDEAHSRAYVQARHQRAGDAGGAVFDSNGEYLDRWARRPEGWRIVHREARWFSQSGEAAIIGYGEG